MNDLGDLLRELRGSRSLREIGEITELSHTYIADIEKGYRRGTKKPINPSPETLKRLADAYNYPYEDLMKIAGYLNEENTQHQVKIADVDIILSNEEYQILLELKKHPVAFEDLKSNPEKKIKQMIYSWDKIKELLKDIDEDDGDYLE
ncbi:helix-turn-helix transcriptional regulator [Lysinibacillus sp. KU-BSD001]|uniref:helix-turn-helix domain-containing protein n=1 Tax=Lysinibacillus sp. KU-BSD001 TaxID=3141328 RepID=UPI0036E76E06